MSLFAGVSSADTAREGACRSARGLGIRPAGYCQGYPGADKRGRPYMSDGSSSLTGLYRIDDLIRAETAGDDPDPSPGPGLAPWRRRGHAPT